MRIVALLLIGAVLLGACPAQACDRAAAGRAQLLFTELAVWLEKGEVVIVKWGPDWDMYDDAQRLKILTAFADIDACLNYDARDIHFYRYGKLVGKATPNGGIRLLK